MDKLVNQYLETRSEQDLEAVIESAKPMIYHLINNYYSNQCHYDKIDYYQMIMMRFPQWINNYQPGGSARVNTYLYTCSKNYFLKLLRREGAKKRNCGNCLYFDQPTANGTLLTEVISDGVDNESLYLMQYQTKSMYDRLYNMFGDEARFYIAFLEGYKIKSISIIYDVGEPEIRRVIEKIRRILRKNPNLLQ